MEVLHKTLTLAIRTLGKGTGPGTKLSNSKPNPPSQVPTRASASDFKSPSDPSCCKAEAVTPDAGVEWAYWEWEAAVRRFTDQQLRRWVGTGSGTGSLKGKEGLRGRKSLAPSASAPSLSSSSSSASSPSIEQLQEEAKESQRRGPLTLFPSAGIVDTVRSFASQRFSHLLWSMVSAGIFLAPLAICGLVALAFPSLIRPALCTWLVAEVVFLGVRMYQVGRASKELIVNQIPTKEEVKELLEHIISLSRMGVIEPVEFLSGWFMGAPKAHLSRRRIKEFIAFGLYHRDFSDLPEEYQAAVDENVSRIEERWGIHFTCRESSQPKTRGGRLPGRRTVTFADLRSAATDQEQEQQPRSSPTTSTSAAAAAAAAVAAVAAQEDQGVAFVRGNASSLRDARSSRDQEGGAAGGPAEGGSMWAFEALGKEEEGRAGAEGEGEEREPEVWGHEEENGQRVSFMAHTKEPLRAVLHPLALYAWGHTVGLLTAVCFLAMGFERRRCKSTGLRYYVLRRDGTKTQGRARGTQQEEGAQMMAQESQGRRDEGDEEDKDSEACVFVHGLGVGVTPYIAFIQEILRASPHKTLAVVELPHLAMRLANKVPTVDDLVLGLDTVLDDCAGPGGRATCMGHSYGSLVLAQYTRTRPHRVASLGLIDPVCILLCLPYVIYNFVYKYSDFKDFKGTMLDMVRLFMCSREFNVARALCRGFNWHNLYLWAHQMPVNTVVMLAGRDRIVPSPKVKKYLEAKKIPVVYNEKFGHAQYLLRPNAQRTFLNLLFKQ